MGEVLEFLFGALFLFFIFTFLLRGLVKAFRRNWIVALLLLLFFSPALIVWAVVETVLIFQRRTQTPSPEATNATPMPVSGAINPGLEASSRAEQELRRTGMTESAPPRLEQSQPIQAQYRCMQCEAPIRLNDSKCRRCGARA